MIFYDEKSDFVDFVDAAGQKRSYLTISRLRDRLTGSPANGFIPDKIPLIADGGENFSLVICADDDLPNAHASIEPSSAESQFLNLENLSGPGGSVPTLVLRRCIIRGTLSFNGSHLAGLVIQNCRLRGIISLGAQIDNDCTFERLEPLLSLTDGLSSGGASEPWQHQDQHALLKMATALADKRFCQIRINSSRVDGSLIVSNCLLSSPREEDWPEQTGRRQDIGYQINHWEDPKNTGNSANYFALSLAGTEIGGRLQFIDGSVALGGLNTYQTNIRNSVRITGRLISAHDLEPPNGGAMQTSQYCALYGVDMEVGGSFFWLGYPAADGIARQENLDGSDKVSWRPSTVCGRIVLSQARIGGDLHIERVESVFLDPARLSDKNMAPVYETGDIDLRRATIGGQFLVGNSKFGRRSRPMSGMVGEAVVGPALDAWKAKFELGAIIAPTSEFRGPIYFSGAKFGRELRISGKISLSGLTEARVASPYEAKLQDAFKVGWHTALDLSDCFVSGLATFNLTRIEGRASVERLHLDGSMQIDAINFFQIEMIRERNWKHDQSRITTQPGIGTLDKSRCDISWDQPSLFDMQDLYVSGGINLKRNSISIFSEAFAAPLSGYTIDMRGMSCSSWDDADATCWEGLNSEPLSKRWFFKAKKWKPIPQTPWRLRFEGIQLARLDRSSQLKPVDVRNTRGANWLRWYCGNILRVIGMAKSSRGLLETERTRHTIDYAEVQRFRMEALGSYYDHRPDRPITDFEKFKDWWVRNFRQPNWRRAEKEPPFLPQPYGMFAKAYIQHGEIKTAATLISERNRIGWLFRIRRLFRAICKVGLGLLPTSLFSLLLGWYSGGIPFRAICDVYRTRGPMASMEILSASLLGASALTLIASTIICAIAPFVGWLAEVLFRYGFGHGLRGFRALGSSIAVMILFCFLPSWAGMRFDTLQENVIYGADKLLPADLGMKDRYAIEWKFMYNNHHHPDGTFEDLRLTKPEALCIKSFGDHDCGVWNKFWYLDTLADFFGWIVFALLALTLSGLVKRGIERL